MPSLRGVVRKVCPRCERGAVYREGLTMYGRRPVCDLKYEHEQGYSLGAMYVSHHDGSAARSGAGAVLPEAYDPAPARLILAAALTLFQSLGLQARWRFSRNETDDVRERSL